MMQLLQIKPSVIPLNNILACVAALPKELKNHYTKDLNIIQVNIDFFYKIKKLINKKILEIICVE